jgi:hypothetical protein
VRPETFYATAGLAVLYFFLSLALFTVVYQRRPGQTVYAPVWPTEAGVSDVEQLQLDSIPTANDVDDDDDGLERPSDASS